MNGRPHYARVGDYQIRIPADMELPISGAPRPIGQFERQARREPMPDYVLAASLANPGKAAASALERAYGWHAIKFESDRLSELLRNLERDIELDAWALSMRKSAA